MRGGEHLLSVKREARVSLHRALIDGLDSTGIGAQYYHRLYYKGVVQIARRVLVRLTQQTRVRSDNPARHERRDVQFLPCGKVFPHNNRYFSVEHNGASSLYVANF